MEVLEFLCSAVTPNFLKMQNDFGFTAAEAAQEKYHLMEESWSNKLAAAKSREDRESITEAHEAIKGKI